MGSTLANIRERFTQLGKAFAATRKVDGKLVPLIIAAPLAVLVIVLVISTLLGATLLGIALAIPLALAAAMVVFGRRASKAQFTMLEGQPGAAAAVLQSMRGPWRVTPAVAFTRKQDFVHRVVGRPGVIMVGEGSPARTKLLLRQEQRKVARVVGDTPVHVVSVGEGEGQVPLGKLRNHLVRLRRSIKRGEMDELSKRLSALGHGDLPVPKGPLPQGVRVPRGRRR